MSRWRYRAADATGAAVDGEIDADSEREAIDALRRRALWVTTLSASGERESVGRRVSERIPARHDTNAGDRFASDVPVARAKGWLAPWAGATAPRDIALLTRAMATLLSAGVPLDRALSYAAAQSPDEPSRQAFGAMRDGVRNGQSLSSIVATQTLFPAYFAPTINAGEASGTLDTALLMLSDHLERTDAVRAKLRAALIYPAVLSVATAIGVTVILLVVVPRFATLIRDSGGTLPLSTRTLIAVSGLTRFWWVAMLAVVGGVSVWRTAMQNTDTRQRWHRALLGWPVIGRLERTRTAAAYTGTLSVALRSGVGLLQAMSLARGVVNNLHMRAQLVDAEARVRDGGTLAASLDGILPALAIRLLDAGEMTGDLATLAGRAADAAESDVQSAVSQAVTLVEPAMILAFGGLVGFVALALLQAIYGINARSL